MIPYGRQFIDDDDIDAVIAVLRGDWLTQGPHIEEFEHGLVDVTGARHAVAFANGTAALHAAAVATGLGPGDRVATSSLSFVASANCARYVGAQVEFIDIEAATLNLDPSAVPVDIDGLVAVHYAGLPVDLSRLRARPRVVIEDAAHALGARTPDGPVGNCARSDACVFSFHPVKTVTTGEGGAVTTNDDEIASRLRRVRTHGIEPRPDEGGWCYKIAEVGFNYRLTDMQAALGSSQLQKLDRFVRRRHEIAARYRAHLGELPLELPPDAVDGFAHAYHLFPIRVAERRSVFDGLRRRGIGVQVHYIPIHSQPLYAGTNDSLPNTDDAYARLLSLPMYPALSDVEQQVVIEALEEVLCAT